jgi:hypothetical protein
MATSRWSVRLAVDQGESGPISRVLHQAVVPEIRRLAISGPVGTYDGDADVVTFELEAQNARHARIVAQHLLSNVLRAARLPTRQAEVLWVTPMLATESSSHRFLDHARTLVENEDGYDLAVVAAQIHLEIQVKVLIQRATASDPSPLVDAVVRQRRPWAPQDRWIGAILEALFGVRVTSYPRWRAYDAHVKRRNDVAHQGQDVDKTAALESIEVVEDFWLWLNDLASRALAIEHP